MNNPEVVVRNSKIKNAWCFYDWANSVYSLVITSTIFPIYYTEVTKTETSDIVSFFGFQFVNTALYSYSLSFSFLIIAFVSPVLSSIADYSGRKMIFLKIFCYTGAVSCSALFFFTADNLTFGIAFFILASIGFSGSEIFYNAYLPEIAEKKEQDNISARGFAMGYIGSVILLILNLLMIEYPDVFNLNEESYHVRISFLLVGAWWAGFAQYTFYHLPKNVYSRKLQGNMLLNGYRQLKIVWRQLLELHALKTFLVAYFFYTAGVQTIMYMAASFGAKELELSKSLLIGTILIIQLVAIGGAYMFSAISSRWGNIKTLLFAMPAWAAICICAYFINDETGFIIVAAGVGMLMGGTQSMSRSTYSKMLPATKDNASFFSFYAVTQKMAIVIGTGLFGFIEQVTGSMRNSVFVLLLFFIIGLLILIRIKKLVDN